jgi:tRNA A-37 threonylcarbamoyl transferase component Bud32
MIPCRIVFNRLPEDVLAQVLRVDELAGRDERWRLLHAGKTRRNYLFTPAPGEPAWVVKWGWRYTSWKKVRDALQGRDQAVEEYRKTRKAIEAGLPVRDLVLLARPRPLGGRLYSLLVAPYLEHSENFIQLLARRFADADLVDRALYNLGGLIAEIHAAGFLHRDLSLDNLLILEANPAKIVVLDWFLSRPNPVEPFDARLSDLVTPLCDFFYYGLKKELMLPLLKGYAEKDPRIEGRFEELIECGRQARLGIMRRAWKNCNWRSHGAARSRFRGYRVFTLKGRKEEAVHQAIEKREGRVSARSRWFASGDSPLLERWRKANLLRAGGLGGHGISAYGVKKGLLRISEILISDSREGFEPLSHLLKQRPSPRRSRILEQAGRDLRHMHTLEMGLKAVDLEQWRYRETEGGEGQLVTDDLDAIQPFRKDLCTFDWLRGLDFRSLRRRDLLHFLSGYLGHRATSAEAKALIGPILGSTE